MHRHTQLGRGLHYGRSKSRSDVWHVALVLLLLTCSAVAGALAQAPSPSLTSSSPPATNSSAPAKARTPAGGDAHTVLLYGAGSYGTLTSLFFLLSALFTDILLIRVWLVLAYIFLTINSILSFPDVLEWSGNNATHKVLLGSVLWSVITLALQLWALAILVWDELPVRLKGDDELLWRMFHRRCGMTQKEFQHVLKLGTWQYFKAGETVERRNRDEPRLYVVFKGRLDLTSEQHDAKPTPLPSGLLANVYLFNLFGIFMGFVNDTDDKTLLLAATDVVLFSWDVAALLRISSGEISIALPAYFRSLALYLVSSEYCRLHLGGQPYSSSGQPEPDVEAWLSGLAMSADFEKLAPEEQNNTKLWGAIWSMLRSFKLTVPRGLRHQPHPKTGAMARSRVLLAAHMRQHQQHVPAALAQNRAVLASQGLHHSTSLTAKLRRLASGGEGLRTASGVPAGSAVQMSSGERVLSSRQADQAGAAC